MPHAPIDIHAHFYPEELIALWRDEGPRCGGDVADVEGKGVILKAGPLATNPLGPRFSDLDARLQAMDEQGVAVHALSLSLPMVYWADKALAQKLSECFNDAAATAYLRHPDRLVGLAMLPMHFPAAALSELARARTLPGVRGVYMATSIAGRELSDTTFFPVYEAIEAAGLPARSASARTTCTTCSATRSKRRSPPHTSSSAASSTAFLGSPSACRTRVARFHTSSDACSAASRSGRSSPAGSMGRSSTCGASTTTPSAITSRRSIISSSSSAPTA
jgi:hypothetical protein